MITAAQRCSICHKQLGTSYCTGCGAYFCMKHFRIHRQSLYTDLDLIIADRNVLKEKFTQIKQTQDVRSPLFTQIDQWETATIAKVKQAAEQAREQVKNVLHLRRLRISQEFKRLSQELSDMKETENFVEHDLTRLKRLIQQFNVDLKHWNQPATIEIHTDRRHPIEWNRLIYIDDKSTFGNMQQKQQQIIGQSLASGQELSTMSRTFLIREDSSV